MSDTQEKFRCGRRGPFNPNSSPFRGEEVEKCDYWREPNRFGGCSYCGSTDPEVFLKFVEEGGSVEPTDKSYKAYCHGVGSGKFYFQHLSEPQMLRFIELYNSQTMKVAYPGYFYVSPFFMGASTPKE